MSSPRVILLCLSLATLVAATAAGAARNPMEDGTLTVRDGRGTLTLKFRGSLIGRLNHGKLTVLASQYGTTTSVVRGWETRNYSTQGIVYSGSNIRFRVGSIDLRGVEQELLTLYAARVTLLRVQSERLVQRVNLYLALGGGFDGPPAIPQASAESRDRSIASVH